MKNGQAGFTLIELVVVLVLMGILAAVAIPQFVNLSGTATTRAQEATDAAVNSALTLWIAQNAATATPYPTVTQLAGAVRVTGGATAVATGVQVTINGSAYTVPTFTNTTCTTATAAVGNTVMCAGN